MNFEMITEFFSIISGVFITLIGFKIYIPIKNDPEKFEQWHKKTGKYLKIAGPIIALVSIVSIFQTTEPNNNYLDQYFETTQNMTNEEVLKVMVREWMKKLPIKVDESTVIENFKIIENGVEYIYRIKGMESHEFGVVSAQFFAGNIISNLKEDPRINDFRKRKFVFFHTIKFDDNKEITITIKPEDYK